ncbi:MAG: RidA family protein [Burkholderiales bacterium]|nr:RidA family protein [Burkholderiales bacterium]
MTSPAAKEIVPVENMAAPRGVWSVATVARPGRLVFVSGLLAKDAAGEIVGVGDVGAQTEQVLKNLAQALKAAGGTLADVVRVDVYIRSMSHFAEIHAVRRRYFPKDPPASTMVEVSRLTDERCLIEITAIAVLP